MALLGDIRKKSWLLILGIGLPLFAFLVGDAFSRGSIFGNPNELGSVAGKPINIQDYNMAYNRLSKDQRLQGASQNYISQMAWNNLVSDAVATSQAEDAGLTFTDEQYYRAAAMFFSSIQPTLIGQNGQVDINATKQLLAELKKAAQSGNPQAQAYYEQWSNFNPETAMLKAEYLNLVSGGVLATEAEAKFAYMGNADKSNISYAFVDYAGFNQKNKIEVSNDDIVAYLKAHKKQFKPEATVNLAYAYYPAKASTQDQEAIVKELNSYLAPQIIKDEASNVTDTIPSFANAKNDSLYVTRFSEDSFDPNFYTKQQILSTPNKDIQSLLSNFVVDKVYGPVKSGNLYELIKITNQKQIIDSAKTSHILISYQGAQGSGATRTPQEAQALADSILTVVKTNPAKFNELAKTLSDDKVAAANSGSIGWVGRNQQGIDPSYKNFAVTHDTGSLDLVASSFGFHIIRVDAVKRITGYQIAAIKKELKASDKTQEKLFNDANQLALDSQGKSANDFINAARKNGAEVNTADGLGRFTFDVTGLNDTQKIGDIMSWAFNKDNNPGSIERFETTNGGQIIVYLNNKFSKDEYNVAAYKGQISDVIKNRLAVNKAKTLVKGKTDLKSIADALGGKTGTAANISYNMANIAGVGVEPMVGATALSLKENQVSGVIQGTNGIFVIKVDSKVQGAKKEDYSQEIKNLEAQNGNSIQRGLIPSFIASDKVDDYRAERLK